MTDPRSTEPRTWVIVLTGLIVVLAAFGAVTLWWNGVGIVGWIASRPPLRVAGVFGGLLALSVLLLALSHWRWRRSHEVNGPAG